MRRAISDICWTVKSHEDARSYSIKLTAWGNELEEMHRRMHEDIAEVFMKQLNQAELERLIELLKKAVEG